VLLYGAISRKKSKHPAKYITSHKAMRTKSRGAEAVFTADQFSKVLTMIAV
jgi:hypothetical protein